MKNLRIKFSLLLGVLTHSLAAQTAIMPGDLLITEVLANPAAVSDSSGEWFEIFNTSSQAIDLNGLLIKDSGSNNHIIQSASPLLINAEEYFVLGRDGNQSTNGNYHADYVFNSFTLGNTRDEIILEFNGITIDALFYDDAIFGTAGNSIEWVNGAFSLTPESLTFGEGDSGTPGMANSGPLNSPISPVPIPSAALLFMSAVSGLLLLKQKTLSSVSTRLYRR